VPQHSQSRLKFMTDAHRRIRYFAVSELINKQEPIEPAYISEALNIELGQVQLILRELQENLFFVVLNEAGAVIWAYPVTVKSTPDRLSFASGERLYAA